MAKKKASKPRNVVERHFINVALRTHWDRLIQDACIQPPANGKARKIEGQSECARRVGKLMVKLGRDVAKIAEQRFGRKAYKVKPPNFREIFNRVMRERGYKMPD